MKRILILSGFLLLFSCGSTEKNRIENEADVLPGELSELSDDDFKPKKLVRYNERADYHIIEDLVDDALKDETLAKIEKDVKLSGALSRLVEICYSGEVDFKPEVKKLYKKYNKNPSYWNQVASCYLLSREYRKAKIFYNKSLSLDKNFVPAINNLGVVYLKEGKHSKALAAFQEAVKVKKYAKTARYNLASLYLKFGLVRKVIPVLSKINKWEKDKDILLAMAYADLYTGNGVKAVRYLSKVKPEYLKKVEFSLALLYAYKLSKNSNYTKIEDFLEGSDMTRQQANSFEKIKGI